MAAPLVAPAEAQAGGVRAQDPLHHTWRLSVPEEGATVEWTSDFEGTLHVWVESADFDPSLSVDPGDGLALREDDDSGGGTTAWLGLGVAPGQRVRVRVEHESVELGAAVLHLVAAPESEATRAADRAGEAALEEVERLRVGGEFDAARERLALLLDRLDEVEGRATSARLAGLTWRAAGLALGLGATDLDTRARAAVVAALERFLPASHRDLIGARGNLAVALKRVGDLEGALQLEQEVYDQWIRLLEPDHPSLQDARNNLATTRLRLGDLAGARELQERVVAGLERQLEPDDPALLAARVSLAATWYALGELEAARELLERVHARWVRELAEDDGRLIGLKVNLSNARHRMGDLVGARELEEQVIAQRARVLPADHLELLGARLNLVATRRSCGDLAGALLLGRDVLEQQEATLPPDHPDLLSSKQNLAVILRELGDPHAALVLEEEVLELRRRRLGETNPALIGLELNFAATRKELGDYAGARLIEERVHDLLTERLAADHPDLISARHNLGQTLHAMGDWAGALELLSSAFEACEQRFPPEHPTRLAVAHSLARTHLGLGQGGLARTLIEPVRAAWAGVLPAGHPYRLRSQEVWIEALLACDEHQGAAVAIGELLSGQIARIEELHVESPRAARAGAATELARLSRVLSWTEALEVGAAEALSGEIFRVLEGLRQVSTGSLSGSREPLDAAEQGLLRRLAEVRGGIGDLTQSPPAAEDEVDAWRAALFAATSARDTLERELREGRRERGGELPVPTVEAVAAALDEGAALITYYRYARRSDVDAETGRRPAAVDCLVAFAVTPDGRVARVELGPAAELEALVLRWRALIDEPVLRGAGLNGPHDVGEVGRALRRRALDACLARIGGEARPAKLHLILDDFLHLLPVDALPAQGERLLGDAHAVQIEASLGRLMSGHAEPVLEGELLALGGIDFDAGGDDAPGDSLSLATPPLAGVRGRARTRFGGLLQTRFEVEALLALHDSLTGAQGALLTGEEATKRALFELAPGARYLHLATHGWFADDVFPSALEDRGASSLAAADFARAEGTRQVFAPATLCGLALAGANRGLNDLGKVPGILTAEELAALDLSNCELAVLSACETNVGVRRAGQGIQSLQSALHTAGARTAITSLWKVDDAYTRRLMERFYTNMWGAGMGKSEALWAAKMSLRDEGARLRHWAAWVLSGEAD